MRPVMWWWILAAALACSVSAGVGLHLWSRQVPVAPAVPAVRAETGRAATPVNAASNARTAPTEAEWGTPACASPPHWVEPVSEADAKDFWDWAAASQSQLKEANVNVNAFHSAYWIDFNNDGRREYVFTEYHGSGGWLGLTVFHKTESGFTYDPDALPAPPELDGHGPWYADLSGFAELCGKTYFAASAIPSWKAGRDVFIWEKQTGTRRACTPEWMAAHRQQVKTLSAENRFGDARSYLETVLERCEAHLPQMERLSIWNDLASAALGADDPQGCLEVTGSIQRDPAFQTLPGPLQEAVGGNARRCAEAAQRESSASNAGQYDYSWLLAFEGKSGRSVWADARFDELLAAVVPYPKPGARASVGGRREELKGNLARTDKLRIRDGRYITLSGCFPGSCGTVAMVWVDTQQKVSAMASGNYTGNSIHVASRSLTAKELPAELIADLRWWGSEHAMRIGEATFEDFSGKEEDISNRFR